MGIATLQPVLLPAAGFTTNPLLGLWECAVAQVLNRQRAATQLQGYVQAAAVDSFTSIYACSSNIFTSIYACGSSRLTPPKWQKNDLVSGGHGQAGSWRGQWTGVIGSAPVQIGWCGLDGALSWCGQGEGQSFFVSSWAACAVAAVPSFQTCCACVHMYIWYACVYICVCVYVYGNDILYHYVYSVYICMCVCICTSMRLYTCVCVCVCMFVHRLWVLVSVLQRVDGVMHAHVFSCAYACVYIYV